ncbi:unnamed protein product [Mucor hiemalis]
MASRLLLRAALKVRPTLANTVRRTYLSAGPLRTTSYLPSLTSTVPHIRSFSLTTPCFSNGEVDSELVHQLEEEMQFEESDEKNEVPAFVKEFLDSNLFKIEDNVGSDKVTLTRTFGNENISVVFSISDINNTVEEFEEEDEELNLKDAPKDESDDDIKEIEEKKEEVEEEEEEASFPVRATVLVQKEGKGCLVLNTVAQDGYLHIDAVRYFKEGQLDKDEIVKGEIGEQRQDLYMGPVYEELDEDLQQTFCKYLEERGIDTALATFLPDYVDYKEQKEYVNWLKDVNDFVSA